MEIKNGRKHYVGFKLPETREAFEHYVINAARKRLNGSAVCTNKLHDLWPIKNSKELIEAVNSIVEDTTYYN